MTDYSYTSLILILPLAVFLLAGLFGKKAPAQWSGFLGTASMLAAAVMAYLTAYNYFFVSGKSADDIYEAAVVMKHTWLSFTPELSIDMGIILDPISVMMLVVVTTVSLMVHIYSMGYMHGENRYHIYYAFLSLFSFSMLGLVVSTNIFQMYIFWELVGVSSFLLIGFYYDRPSAVAASKKAFIVTRFADLGFLIGILVLSYISGSLDFFTITERMTDPSSSFFATATSLTFMGASLLTWALVLIFAGGAGKSAMFPLHIWLPDAMEGPTPVSALIHAATMVVAGVYLVARLFPVFAMIPVALDVVMWVGVISALFAAVIACTQTDIKRVLAYSTMSQIGYMMFSLGVARSGETLGYMASMFHLFTHAMFKALLFLCAGAVIHYVHSNEMKDMGGLRKKMPVTHALFLAACLAIAGIPPFAGFFSKEEILTAALHHHPAVYFIGLCTAGLTAFYMFRLYYRIFWNKPYEAHSPGEHAHGEAPVSMLLPLLFLGAATVVAGFVPFHHLVTSDGRPLETEFHLSYALVAVSVAVTGIVVSSAFYAKRSERPARISAALGSLYQSAYRKFYIDELYLFFTQKVIFNMISRPAAWVDKNVVDGAINMMADISGIFSNEIKGMQSGKLNKYVIWFFIGSMLLALMLVFY